MHTAFNSPANNNKSLVRDAAIQITCNSEGISREILDGMIFFSTTRRGVEYTAYYSTAAGSWFVASHRKALGRSHIGGGRYYNTLDDLAANCKAFAALPVFIALSTK